MSLIRAKNTKPELLVRRLVRDLGYTYRLNVNDLPGRPDLVLKSQRKVIFVHGCFWHQHGTCSRSRIPKTRQEFWIPKFQANKARDEHQISTLKAMGWSVLIIWECEIGDASLLFPKLLEFLLS